MFRSAVEKVLSVEGGYVNDPADSGGETNFGITVAVAMANGYAGPMVDMTRDQAIAIYKRQYWDIMRLDDVAELSQSIAHELFDTCVNMGAGVAGRFLQRALNALNREQRDYPDLTVDGLVGPASVSALRACLTRRGASAEVVILRVLNALQGAFYIDLAERRQKDERFVFGWFLNRVVI